MLQLFQTGPDMALRWVGLTLLPIPEVKVALNDSRHFVVSRGYPQSDEFFTALKNGVVKLRKEDAIVAIYRQAGVIGNPKTKNWRLLNPVAVP